MFGKWCRVAVAIVGLSMGSVASADDSEIIVADRIFDNADKDSDSSLDEEELSEAKRILKTAIFNGMTPAEVPGGPKVAERIEALASAGKLVKDVTKEQWRNHITEACDKRNEILKSAREQVAAAKKAAAEKAKIQQERERELRERMQRQKQQQQRQQQQKRQAQQKNRNNRK